MTHSEHLSSITTPRLWRLSPPHISGYLSADHCDYWLGLMLVGSVRTGGFSHFGVANRQLLCTRGPEQNRSAYEGSLEALSPSGDSFQVVLSKFAPLRSYCLFKSRPVFFRSAVNPFLPPVELQEASSGLILARSGWC